MPKRREAMLRPEFGDWYPTVTPGQWYPADELTGRVLAHRRSGTPQWAPEQRVPSDEHFEFRGGASGGRSPARTRHADPSAGRPPTQGTA